MNKETFTINKIIADADIKKWQLAQRLNVSPSYVTTQLRDGIKTDKGILNYYKALKYLLETKLKEINKSKQTIKEAEKSIGNASETKEKAE